MRDRGWVRALTDPRVHAEVLVVTDLDGVGRAPPALIVVAREGSERLTSLHRLDLSRARPGAL